jgi:hypothetical protein
MVSLGFGHGAYFVDEGQGLRKVFKRIQPFEMAFRAQCPSPAEFLQ